MGRNFAPLGVLSATAATAVAATALGQTVVNESVAATPPPDPRVCEQGVGLGAWRWAPSSRQLKGRVVVYSGPRAGRVFTGAYLCIEHPARVNVTKLTCDARIGGVLGLKQREGAVYFKDGIRLRPIIRRVYTRPDSRGKRHLSRATCGWRIPRWAKGKLLSLIHPPEDVPCEDCEPWGLHVETDGGAGILECNQPTWRIGGFHATLGRLVKPRQLC